MPNVTGATATDYRTVRVTFSGALADRTTGPNGARNPANWTLTGQLPGPVADVVVDHVDEVSTSSVDLQLAAEPTFSKDYLVVAKPFASGGITGVVAPANQATLVALGAPVVDGRSFAIAGLVPRKNWREDDSGDLANFVACLEDVFGVLLLNVDRWVDILDLDLAPDDYLDLMLRDLGFKFEAFTLATAHKRRVLRALVALYGYKGTEVGLLAAIRLLMRMDAMVLASNLGGLRLGNSQLDLDWVLGGSQPYDFWVKVLKASGDALTADEEQQLGTIIKAWKPAHTHLANLDAVLGAPTTIGATGGVGQVTITWSAVANATGYVMYVRNASGVSPFNGQRITGVTSPHVLTPVPAGQSRYAVVCALNTAGIEGFPSEEAGATAS